MPPQQSVALENYLERTKLEIVHIVFFPSRDNLSAKQRQTLKVLSTYSELSLKKVFLSNYKQKSYYSKKLKCASS